MNKCNFALVGLVLIAVLIGFSILGCEPGGEPIVDNQRNQDVTIYIAAVYEDGTLEKAINYGVVPAQTTKKLASVIFAKKDWVYRIEAKNPSGNVVFSHDYNMDDLERINWKITIAP